MWIICGRLRVWKAYGSWSPMRGANMSGHPHCWRCPAQQFPSHGLAPRIVAAPATCSTSYLRLNWTCFRRFWMSVSPATSEYEARLLMCFPCWMAWLHPANLSCVHSDCILLVRNWRICPFHYVLRYAKNKRLVKRCAKTVLLLCYSLQYTTNRAGSNHFTQRLIALNTVAHRYC